MSNKSNDDLLELASHHIEYWTGTTFGEVLQSLVDRGDLEGLQEELKESARLMYEYEKMDVEPMTDETADQLYNERLWNEKTDTY